MTKTLSQALSYPKLRWPLDIQRLKHEGQEVVVLRCQQGVAPQAAVFPVALLALLSRFDGTRSAEDIVAEGAPYGVTKELVAQLIDELDQLYFLENERTEARWKAIKKEFSDLKIRPANFAGGIYPADAAELKKTLNNYISKVAEPIKLSSSEEKVVAMICPHIDYNRGWKTYASAYSILQQVEKVDVVFLFGTAHQPATGIYHLCDKVFDTPLGQFQADLEVISSICALYGRERLFAEEYLHRTEHSLELQLPFLAHRYQQQQFPRLVPILVGSFHNFLINDLNPLDDAEVGDFVATLAEVIKSLRDSGKRVLLFGGVDLAHMGQHFGDHDRIADSQLENIEKRDRELLDLILNNNESGLFEHMAEDRDRRRICGFPSIFTMLATMKRAGINVFGHSGEYRQAVDKQTDCIVTFASACWTERV